VHYCPLQLLLLAFVLYEDLHLKLTAISVEPLRPNVHPQKRNPIMTSTEARQYWIDLPYLLMPVHALSWEYLFCKYVYAKLIMHI
jgi:hypothetical protein